MKLTKIFALALSVAALSSCSDDKVEDYPNFLGAVNTEQGVTVSLPTTFSANENEQPFYLPVTVNGETNGKVTVTLKVTELTSTPAGTEPAKQVEHFNVTSTTINIPAGETVGSVEIYPVWETGVINDDRVFEISIVSAQGATVENATCQVTIANIDDPYTSMCGRWTCTATSMTNGANVSWTLNVKTVDPSDEEYGSTLMAWGFAGENDYAIPLTNFSYDLETGTGTVEIGYGHIMSNAFFNYGLDDYAAPFCLYRTSSGVTMNHQEICTFDDSYSELVIPASANIFAGLFYYSDGSYSGYYVAAYTNFVMTR